MREFLAIVGCGIAAVAGMYAVATSGLIFSRHAAPYAEETRRRTYDQSRAYQQGMAIDLDELCRQRKLSTDEGVKAALADTIRLRSARFQGDLPYHVQECLNEVR